MVGKRPPNQRRVLKCGIRATTHICRARSAFPFNLVEKWKVNQSFWKGAHSKKGSVFGQDGVDDASVPRLLPWSSPPQLGMPVLAALVPRISPPLAFSSKRRHRVRPQNYRARHPKRGIHLIASVADTSDKACVASHFASTYTNSESMTLQRHPSLPACMHRRRCHRPPRKSRKSCTSYRGSSWRTSWTRVPQTLAQTSGECADKTTVEQITDVLVPQVCEATVAVAPITAPDSSSQTVDIFAQNIPQRCPSQPPERIVDVPVNQRQEKFENVALCPPQEPCAAPALVLCETTARVLEHVPLAPAASCASRVPVDKVMASAFTPIELIDEIQRRKEDVPPKIAVARELFRKGQREHEANRPIELWYVERGEGVA